MEEKNYRCSSCGAGLKKENKTCEYCGSMNKYYQEEKVQDMAEAEDTNFSVGEILDDILGGVMGGMMIGSSRRRSSHSRDNRRPRIW